MSDNREVAKDIIVEAGRTILQKRPGVHGSAEQSFIMIGDLWTVYIRHLRRVRGTDTILPEDVAQMMTLLKKARALYGDATNRDNFIDDVGYTALAGMLQLPDPREETPVETGLSEGLDVTQEPALRAEYEATFPRDLPSADKLSPEEILRKLYGAKNDE